MNPDSDRKTLVLIARWSYDVQIETVLALLIPDLITSISNAFLVLVS